MLTVPLKEGREGKNGCTEVGSRSIGYSAPTCAQAVLRVDVVTGHAEVIGRASVPARRAKSAPRRSDSAGRIAGATGRFDTVRAGTVVNGAVLYQDLDRKGGVPRSQR